MANWDVIVIGLGGVGSSAAYHTALAGRRVLGIEQFTPAHDQGSSHGQTRIIRQAYFEDPSYVPMLKRAYELWDQLESHVDERLFERTGLVELGPADGTVIPGILASAEQHQLPIEELSVSCCRERWPGLDGDEDWTIVIEKNAGFLRVEECVAAHLEMARRTGATLQFETPVVSWRVVGNGVQVETEKGTETADRLILAGGAWSSQLLTQLRVPLQILRKHLYWFDTDDSGFEKSDGFPCFFHDTEDGYFYGFPSIQGGGVKVARHSGGQALDTPQQDSSKDTKDLALCEKYVQRYLPGVSKRLRTHATCFYTSTPDEHFIMDRHPEHDQVTIVAGLSGHGFKFTSAIGEIASQLACERSPFDLELFKINRFEIA